VSLAVLSCQSRQEDNHPEEKKQEMPSEIMKDAEVLYSDSARVKMKLLAKVLNHYTCENPYIEMPNGLQMFFYDDSLKIHSQMKGDYGIRYEKDGKMEAKKNVEVVNVKGDKLNTEHLIWDEQKDSIYTKAFVKITTKDEVIYGDGLESNHDFTKYRIKKVKGVINVKEENPTNKEK
jgi:LPS export ABC transporter protein LptC